jgi:hypothetical protein
MQRRGFREGFDSRYVLTVNIYWILRYVSNLMILVADSGLAARNEIHGTIPTELALLTDLIHLDLDNNLIEGTIPSQIYYEMTNLETFWAMLEEWEIREN